MAYKSQYKPQNVKRREEQLKKSLNTFNFVEHHLDTNTHLYDRHINKQTSDHIDRVLDTNTDKPTLKSSSFESERDMYSLIKAAIRNEDSLSEIAAWLESDRKNELQIDFESDKDEPVGRGVIVDPRTKKIAEYETNYMTLRLAKNNNFPNGFAIVTAFPVLNEQATPTGRDLTHAMHLSETYKKANVIDKTLYNIVCNPAFDTDKLSIGTAGAKGNHHTLYISQVDPVNDAFTHRFSINTKKCLFQTYKSMDFKREAVKTDFITDKDQFNAISMRHNPQGMEDVYAQLPDLGRMIDIGYKAFQKELYQDPEFMAEHAKRRDAKMRTDAVTFTNFMNHSLCKKFPNFILDTVATKNEDNTKTVAMRITDKAGNQIQIPMNELYESFMNGTPSDDIRNKLIKDLRYETKTLRMAQAEQEATAVKQNSNPAKKTEPNIRPDVASEKPAKPVPRSQQIQYKDIPNTSAPQDTGPEF